MTSKPSDAAERLDQAPCGLLQTGEDGLIRAVNRTFCSWVGHTTEELLRRRRFQDMLTMGSKIFHHTHWAPLLRMQGSITEVKLEVKHREGHVVPMILNAVRIEREGTVVHEIAAYVARDRDRYEQELVRSRGELQKLVAERTDLHAIAQDRALVAEQMIGIVSHDLRNPLGAIQMGAALLSSQQLPAPQQRVVDRILRATDRASRLIVDLLDFTQARLGRGLATSLAPIALHDVVGDTLEELRLAHPQRALVHERVGEGMCIADGGRLAQLVGNLVSNAVAYGDAEAPITVTSTIGGASCSIAVHNAGRPIPAELQATLFEPLTRGHHEGNAARSIGLGLFIVREIARAHGGTVELRSSLEDGTTFDVSWPQSAT